MVWGRRKREAEPSPTAGETPAESGGDELELVLVGYVVDLSEGRLASSAVSLTVDVYEAGYLDSLNVTDFLVRVDREHGVSIPDWAVGGQHNTLRLLAAFIREHRNV